MTERSIDLIQYAVVGAGLFLFMIVGIRALFFKSGGKRKTKKEIKRKKKVSRKEKRQQAKAIKKDRKKESKRANKKTHKKARRKKKKRNPVNILEQVKRLIPKKQNATKEKLKPITLHFYNLDANVKGEDKKFIMQNSLTVGRSIGEHQWAITDDITVSSNHCKIYQKGQRLYIVDLNSTNGTYINDQKIKGEMPLTNQDKIRIGHSEYRISF